MALNVIKEKFNIIEDNSVLSTPSVNIYYSDENLYNAVVIQGDSSINIYDYLNEVKDYLKVILNKYPAKNIYIDNSSIYGFKTKNWMTKLIIEKDANNSLSIKNIKTIYELKISAADSDYSLLSSYINQKYKQALR